MSTWTSCKGHALWSVNFDPRLFLCFIRLIVISEFGAITATSLLRRFFWSFLFLSLARKRQCLPRFLDKNSPNHGGFLCYSWAFESHSQFRFCAQITGPISLLVVLSNHRHCDLLAERSLPWNERLLPLAHIAQFVFTAGFDFGKPRRCQK